MFGLNDTFSYFQCSNCECLQIEEVPKDMSKYYPEDYYSQEDPKVHFEGLKNILIKIRDRYAVWGTGILGKQLSKYFPRPEFQFFHSLKVTKETSIIDIGSGAGSMLYALKELGIENILGIDPYISQDLQYENGLIIQKKDITEVGEKWDIIMFHHSFEHLHNQEETLQCVSNLLTEKGYCIIRIPIVSSYAWEHYGINWVQLDAPRHLFLHSIKSMNVLANKTGLKLEKVEHDSNDFQFWGSEQYLDDIPLRDTRSYAVNPENSKFSKKDIADFKDRAKELNKNGNGDMAIFYLRKN